MVKITRVYTKTGDKGSTKLAAGESIPKSAARIVTIGTIDELNAALGMTRALLTEQSPRLDALVTKMLRIQNELFNLGSQLSVLTEQRKSNTPLIQPTQTQQLEHEIDKMNESLPNLTSFILPGSSTSEAQLHIARTICRRAERVLVNLSEEEPLDGVEIPYLNRLSDWLFVAARHTNQTLNSEELLWQP